jgi:hypothetical protein
MALKLKQQFDTRVVSTNVTITNGTGNSANIYGDTFYVLLTYIE